MVTNKTYKSFWEFYPYYLTEHSRPATRTLHFIGTALVIFCFVGAFALSNGWLFFILPFCGYGFAWVGHFFLEKNKPATFQYPLYSLGSDFVMFWHILTGQINKRVDEAHNSLGIINKWK
ncbi:MAG TPA: DUF962 domain-containing protein [Chitinophagales bacterium]|nr:DUF962 domain-containing protein [Chitinophagales bacterium]HRP40352.1 DUF962 domain-containing protein [Chitinophagales bacterium]